MISYKSIKGNEKKVLDVIVEELSKNMAEETCMPIELTKQSIIQLIEKELIKIEMEGDLEKDDLRFRLIPNIPELERLNIISLVK